MTRQENKEGKERSGGSFGNREMPPGLYQDICREMGLKRHPFTSSASHFLLYLWLFLLCREAAPRPTGGLGAAGGGDNVQEPSSLALQIG